MLFQAWWLLFCLQLLSLPLLAIVSWRIKAVKDGLWAFAKIAVCLFLALLTYFIAWAKIPINTVWGVRYLAFMLLLFDMFLLFFSDKQKWWQEKIKDYWHNFKRSIIIEELVFTLFFAFILVMRSFQPDVLGLEKFMDAGFIQAYLKSPTLPAMDIWAAGLSINYYSFGHFLMAIITQFWGLDLAYAYNILLAVLAGMFASEIFSLVFNLRANFKWGENLGRDYQGREKYNFRAAVWTGLLASFLVTLAGNAQLIWYFFSQGSFKAYWYPDATRFIEQTIHEFPGYSFVVADLHAHVLALPIVALVLTTIYLWLSELIEEVSRQKVLKVFAENFSYLALFLGSLLGVLAMTNTWDLMIYAVFLLLIGILLLIWRRSFFWPLAASALLVGVGALTTSLIWFLNFENISEGIRVATKHSPIWQLFALWGPQLILATILILILFKFWPRLIKRERSSWFFAVAGWLLFIFLLVFTELFYFKDIYLTHQRANTMFKLMFQGFIILTLLLSLSLSALWSVAQRSRFFSWRLVDLRQVIPERRPVLFRIKVFLRSIVFCYLPMLILFFFLAAYPYLAFKSYYLGSKEWRGLNGLAWMEKKAPSSKGMVDYLKATEPKQINILEASGKSYSEYSLVSAFSGMPTVLGWQVHEWLWRGSWDFSSQRMGEIKEVYLRPRSAKSRAILDRYQIKYVILSNKEREQYSDLDEIGLLSLGSIAWQSGQDYLILIQK